MRADIDYSFHPLSEDFLEAVSVIFDRSIRVKFTISFKISVLKEVDVL